jgi:NitT/TauT family transport system permease protein
VFILLVWQFIVDIQRIPTYLVPSPLDIAKKSWSYRGILLADTWVTLFEACAGFLLGAGIAILTGVFIGLVPILRRAAYPLLVALQAVPVVAIAPIIIIWFGNGTLGKAIMAALICYFPVAVNTIAGIQSVTSEYRDLFQVMAATPWQVFWKLKVPFSLPYVFTGLRIGAGLSSIGAIVAELAGAQRGLGFRILVASYQLDTPLMFAAIFVAGIVGVVFFYAVVLVGRRFTSWAVS